MSNPRINKNRRAKRDRSKNAGKREQSIERIMSTPFIAWDGEGYTDENGEHHYFLLANSLGDYIVAEPGKSINRKDAFDFFWTTHKANPTAYNVIYGGSYDFNCIIRGQGLPKSDASYLYDNEQMVLDGYIVSLIPSKILRIKHAGEHQKAFVLYDTLSFFQRSFIQALDEYFGVWPNKDLIVKNKALRGSFRLEELPSILEYCLAELDLLVMLMNELRSRLNDADLLIKQWYGPGAIAALLFKRYHIAGAMDTTINDKLPELGTAVRCAYAGGRFELITPCDTDEPAYEYDINSAYPYAMTKLPNLSKGYWKHHEGIYRGQSDFVLYRLEISYNYTMGEHIPPMPLFHRSQDKRISYPSTVNGWYWRPEYDIAREFADKYSATLTVHEVWEFVEDDPTDKPFAFIAELYKKRQELKAAGSGAHVGIKLGLNSMYGKLAQQIGWDAVRQKIPPYHQLEWAGYITSHCRAQAYKAILPNIDDVIAFETDAVFTRSPLPHLTVGTGLGEWEYIKFDSLMYLQSGVRFTSSGVEIERKTRGFHQNYADPVYFRDQLAQGKVVVKVPTSTFVTLGSALYTKYSMWCQWIQRPRTINLMCFAEIGKRRHLHPQDCEVCGYNEAENRMYFRKGYHKTYVPSWYGKTFNIEHSVAWINDPDSLETKKWDMEIEEEWI